MQKSKMASSSNEEIISDDKVDFGQDQTRPKNWRRPSMEASLYANLDEKDAVLDDRAEFLEVPRYRFNQNKPSGA